ncbi:hypothetical protein BJ508DRAFT_413861 [Ascobolus immersus RN42]|uniref:Uncharacterized protein n=1 Tax=Ascobolus immersus RN42 TaxID=1160509 RepID=A0A3N4IB52_ASCIM|nr:hypothetical protein BJ508DRAFT_413861 [Ascobolus immersus RN42]
MDHEPPKELQDQLLYLLPTFIYPEWQSHNAQPNESARRMAEKYPELFTSKPALETLLRGHVQPFFMKSLPDVTEAGHARLQEGPKSRRVMALEESKPGDAFASVRPEAPGLLQFVVDNLRTEDLKDLWPLIIPPLLHLIGSTSYRIRGIAYKIAGTLFEKTPSSLLDRTGLFTILWDSLQKGLFSLPPLTPLHHSLNLVDSSLLALRRLAALHPTNPTSFRATLLKEGILDREFSTSENIALTNVYLKHISGILHDSDLEGTKELMNRYRSRLIPIIRKRLADPFVSLDKTYLCNLASTLTSIICADVDGMRTEQWNMEIIAGVGLAWVRLEQEGKARKLDSLIARRELRRVMISLRGIIGEDSVGWGTIERVSQSRGGVMAGLVAREDPDKDEWERLYKTSGPGSELVEKLENMEKEGVRGDEYYKLTEGVLERAKSS